MRVRKHIVFTGEVQGVGFRWRAIQAARMYGCTGWVHNEWDGSVTMEIQGEKAAIDLVVDSLKNGRFIYVQRMTVTDLPVDEDERDFWAN